MAGYIAQWNAPRVMRGMKESARAALISEASRMKAVIQLRISKPYPPESRPGRPPHMRTTRLRRSVSVTTSRQSKVLQPTVSINVKAPYSSFLERGTKRMKKRPFILSTLKMEKSRMRSGIAAAIRAEASRRGILRKRVGSR